MYIKPSEEAEIRFGDIFEAGWLFDAWLEADAARIGPFMAKGGHTGYGAHVARDQDSEFVLAHSNVPKAMLAVNDDCLWGAKTRVRRDNAPICRRNRICAPHTAGFLRCPG